VYTYYVTIKQMQRSEKKQINKYNFKKIILDYRCKHTQHLLAMYDKFIPKLVYDYTLTRITYVNQQKLERQTTIKTKQASMALADDKYCIQHTPQVKVCIQFFFLL
jgi:hypothetical protein